MARSATRRPTTRAATTSSRRPAWLPSGPRRAMTCCRPGSRMPAEDRSPALSAGRAAGHPAPGPPGGRGRAGGRHPGRRGRLPPPDGQRGMGGAGRGGAGPARAEPGRHDRGLRLRPHRLPPGAGRAAPQRLEGLRPRAVVARAQPRLPAVRHRAREGGRGDRRDRGTGALRPAAARQRSDPRFLRRPELLCRESRRARGLPAQRVRRRRIHGAVARRFRSRTPALISTVHDGAAPAPREWRPVMVTLLWILAVVLVIAGIVAIFRGQMLWGIVLIIVGLLVGPGGVSIFT